MIEKIKNISNPLTIIAIFAGLAEVSGASVLPFLSEESQELYIWFLMVFPTVLVVLFFLTLNFNHKVLYAPSDFQDENNFLKMFGKPTADDRLEKLIHDMQSEVSSEKTEGEESLNSQGLEYRSIIQRSAASTHYLAEELVITKLSQEFDEIEKEVMLRPGRSQFLFDAIGKKDGKVFAIEVKYIKDSSSLKNLRASLVKIQKAFRELPDSGRVSLLLAIATDLEGKQLDDFIKEVKRTSMTFMYPLQVKVFNLKSLESELIGQKSL